jgi:hypothetical protein
MARSNVKPSYEDFEPYCKWRIEEGKDTIEVHLHGNKVFSYVIPRFL